MKRMPIYSIRSFLFQASSGSIVSDAENTVTCIAGALAGLSDDVVAGLSATGQDALKEIKDIVAKPISVLNM